MKTKNLQKHLLEDNQETADHIDKEIIDKLIVFESLHEKSDKIKATYYLGKQEHKMLTELYVDQLQRLGKSDRSSLICEAIRSLYRSRKQ